MKIMKKQLSTFLLFALLGTFFCGSLFAQEEAASAAVPATAGNAQEPLRLSPDEAVDRAIKNNLSMESARINLDIKKRKSDLVWNEFLPTVSVSGTLARDNWATEQQGMTIPPIPQLGLTSPIPLSEAFTLPQTHLLGNFSATLDFSFALIQGIRSYKQDYQAGILTYEKTKLQMEQNVRKMYNQLLLLEANGALLTESYLNTQRQAAMAEANYRAGLAPRITMLQAQVAVENMRPTVNDFENNFNALKGNFALLLGLPYNAPFELEAVSFGDSYIPEDVAQLISQAASQRPDIMELQSNIRTMQTQRKALAFQLYTPFLRLGWTLSSTYNPLLDPFKDDWSSDNWNKGGNFSLTLGMSLNSLLPFTKEGQNLKNMDANIQMMNIALAQTIRGTELEVFTKINSLENIRTTAEVQLAAVELAELSYRLTEEAYRAGLQDFQAVQGAALALNQAKLQLMTQQFNYLNDLIDLEYAIGVPFGTLTSKE